VKFNGRVLGKRGRKISTAAKETETRSRICAGQKPGRGERDRSAGSDQTGAVKDSWSRGVDATRRHLGPSTLRSGTQGDGDENNTAAKKG